MDVSILRDKKVDKKDWLVQSTYWRDVVGLLAMMDLGCLDLGCLDLGCLDLGCFDSGCLDCGCLDCGSWVVGRGSWFRV